MEAIIFVGIQASGKSTFYRENFINTHIRLNLDMLKTRHREQIFIQACIEGKQPFVVDNTNPNMELILMIYQNGKNVARDYIGKNTKNTDLIPKQDKVLKQFDAELNGI